MSNWYRKRLVPLTATLGALTCGLLGTGAGTASAETPGTASAGINGQQINYYSNYAYAQCTIEKVQNGGTMRRCTQLRTGSNLDQGQRWIGKVTIYWFRPDHTYIPSTCDVPQSQDSDFVTCYEPS